MSSGKSPPTGPQQLLSTAPSPPPPPPMLVIVTLRRTMLSSLTGITIVTLVVLTAFFQHGYSLKQLDKATQPPKELEALVDSYNSNSGTVSSAIQRPIEIFLSLVVQVVVLHFLAPQLLRSKPSRAATLAVMGLGALLGFLLNNSLAALNIQQRDLPVQSVVLTSDLSQSVSDVIGNVTSVNHSIAEDSKKNPITNSVLRSLLLPRDFEPPEECNARGMPGFEYARDTVDYGIFQRDWMKDMLTEAVDPKTFTLVVNASGSASPTTKQSPSELPMNASLAADLLLNSVFWSPSYIPWGKMSTWSDDTPLKEMKPAAVVAGLLPSDEQASEEAQRTWLVNQMPTFFKRWPIESLNMSANDVVLKFSSVQISSSIVFDSLTVEVDVEPTSLPETTIVNKTTRNTSSECRDYPHPEICMFEKEPRDMPMQIHAYSWCGGAKDSDRLWSLPDDHSTSDLNILCNDTAANSLLMVGVGKRLRADAMDNRNWTAVATNLRKTYAITFGRLSWTYTSLAKTYKATCKANDSADCAALEYSLPGNTKRLVVGPQGVPLKRLRPLNFSTWEGFEPLPLQVVRVYEPGRDYDTTGDILLPHNGGKITFPVTKRGCTFISRVVRLRLVLNNHMYIEHPLQSTYTAAMFLLFQDAVTRDVLPLSNSQHTLAFDGNVQLVDLWISIPTKSAWTTYTGCIILIVALAVVMLWPQVFAPKHSQGALAEITDPHLIARAMLDDSMFPAFALKRHVVDAGGQKPEGDSASAFEIESLTLRHREESAKPEDTSV